MECVIRIDVPYASKGNRVEQSYMDASRVIFAEQINSCITYLDTSGMWVPLRLTTPNGKRFLSLNKMSSDKTLNDQMKEAVAYAGLCVCYVYISDIF
jgi:hypothetical protein